MATPEEITSILSALGNGDGSAVSRLTSLLYAELHGLAKRAMSAENPGHTLQPTALVHEAYLRMLGQENLSPLNRGHFLALAARAMRQILVDHARARSRKKRGGDFKRVMLEGIPGVSPRSGLSDVDLLGLDEALGALAAHDERKARVVELRFFGGLTREETAKVLDVTSRTVERDSRYAQAWLRQWIDSGDHAAEQGEI